MQLSVECNICSYFPEVLNSVNCMSDTCIYTHIQTHTNTPLNHFKFHCSKIVCYIVRIFYATVISGEGVIGYFEMFEQFRLFLHQR